MEEGLIDVKPLITDRYPFEKSIEAFDDACKPRPESVEIQIAIEA